MFDLPSWAAALGILKTAAIVWGAVWVLFAFIMSRPTVMPPIPDANQVRDALRERIKTQRYLGDRDETK